MSPQHPQQPARGTSRLDFHNGKVMLLLASTTYTTLSRVVVECVQNAIDANATNIWVAIDMLGRSIVVADNGDGVDRPHFEAALRSVGQGVKSKDKLGRFGLGLISPLNKCEYFTFTSQPPDRYSALRWTFRGRDIEPQVDSIVVPCSRVTKLHDGRDQRLLQEMAPDGGWHSILRIHKFVQDSQVANMDPDSLEGFIQEKLGPALRKNGITCKLHFKDKQGNTFKREIRPTDYSGTPLPVWTFEEPDAGQVEFVLYQAVRRSTGPKGQVAIMEMDDGYPITWSEFVRQVRNHGLLSQEVLEAMASGIFEGAIRAKRIELHPGRNKFVYNDAVVGVCVAIEEWFRQVGRKVYQASQSTKQDERYQHLGLRSLDRLKELVRLPEYAHLRQGLLDTVKIGTMGAGHNEPGKGRPNGPEDEESTRVGQGGAGKKAGTSSGGTASGTRNPDAPDRPGDVPLTAHGPHGQKRKQVRNDSQGLGISYYPLDEGSSRLWDFDPVHGMLHFNTRHPLWIACDKKDSHLMHLQEWLIIELLTMLSMPESAHDAVRDHIDAQLKPYVDFMVLAPPRR